jgi:hypothetical protein
MVSGPLCLLPDVCVPFRGRRLDKKRGSAVGKAATEKGCGGNGHWDIK